jgi:hypothetical protein
MSTDSFETGHERERDMLVYALAELAMTNDIAIHGTVGPIKETNGAVCI